MNYAQIEKELLTVVFALERFDQYIFGRQVTVKNDHKPLQSILLKPITAAPKRLQRMLFRVQRHTFDLMYVPGSQLEVADALSRAPVGQVPGQPSEQGDLETVCAVVEVQLTDRKMTPVRQATSADQTLLKVQELIKNGWPSDKKGLPPEVIPYFHLRDELACEDGIIFKADRCVIPRTLREDILEEIHRPHLGL